MFSLFVHIPSEIKQFFDQDRIINDTEAFYNELHDHILNGWRIDDVVAALQRRLGSMLFPNRLATTKFALIYSLLLHDFGPREDYKFSQTFFDCVYEYGALTSPIIKFDSSTDCSYMISEKKYIPQVVYKCYTCEARPGPLGVGDLCVCDACAKRCHNGHRLSGPICGTAFCDCGAGELPCKCQCMARNDIIAKSSEALTVAEDILERNYHSLRVKQNRDDD